MTILLLPQMKDIKGEGDIVHAATSYTQLTEINILNMHFLFPYKHYHTNILV